MIAPELLEREPGRDSVRRSHGRGRWVWTGATVFIFCVWVVLILPVVGVPFGYRTMIVTGGSMEPVARVGDAMVVRRVATSALKPGDVISFVPLTTTRLVTHRIVKVLKLDGVEHFQTRGDANGSTDPDLVPAPNVVGEVVLSVSKLGLFYAFATSVPGRLLVVALPALVIAGTELRVLLPKRRRRRRLVPVAGLVASIVVVVLGMAAPAEGVFLETDPVGANAFTASRVAAPNLTSATYSGSLLNCKITLTWTAPSTGLAPDGYDVLRSTANGGPYNLVQHVGTVTTYTDSGLAVLTTYYYVLQSSRSGWRSANSNQRSASTPVLCT